MIKIRESNFGILNTYQQEKYYKFWEAIKDCESLFFDAKYRGIGKTYLINHIGLELQALGYTVFIIIPLNYFVEYYAEKMISLDPNEFRGIPKNNMVILVDEVSESTEKFSDFIKYCQYHKISVIGFVR